MNVYFNFVCSYFICQVLKLKTKNTISSPLTLSFRYCLVCQLRKLQKIHSSSSCAFESCYWIFKLNSLQLISESKIFCQFFYLMSDLFVDPKHQRLKDSCSMYRLKGLSHCSCSPLHKDAKIQWYAACPYEFYSRLWSRPRKR